MKSALYWCWVITLIAAIASIYYGEILMIEPCRLCWYQRIALFPLAYMLGVATYRNDRTIVLYLLPIAIFGLVFAFIQGLGIHFPSLQLCGKECARPIFSLFGVTFPDLSFFAFAIISIILTSIWRRI